jgi:excisionase family DNA binding protein
MSKSAPSLSLDECAHVTGLAWPTLRNAVRDGRLSAVRVGNLIRVSPQALEKFQADRVVNVVPSVKR